MKKSNFMDIIKKGVIVMNSIIVEKNPVAIEGKIVQYTRDDNFTVFLDGDKELDHIRLTCSPEVVIMSVAIRRAQQIARNYARQYKPHLLHKFQITKLEVKKIVNKNKGGEL